MDLRRYADAGSFLARAEDFLVEHEAEHAMILGVVGGLLRGELAEHSPYLAVVEDGPKVVLVALRTPPFPLALSRCAALEALDLVLRDLSPSVDSLDGVNGPPEVSTAFAERWLAATGGRVELRMAQRIYRLDRVTPAARAEGRLRRIEAADRDVVVDWRLDFQRSALGGTRGDAQAVFDRFLYADPKTQGLCLWEVDGRPVSMVGYQGRTPHGIRVNSVYTPSSLRGRGYASAAVATLSQWLLDSGRLFCCLYTDLANPTSNHIYQRIGYNPVAESSLYRLEASW